MQRICNFGMIGLVLSLGLANLNSNFAGAIAETTPAAITTAETTTANELAALAELLPQAKSAQKYAAAHPSTQYPGLAAYLARLIEFAEADEIQDPAALAQALNEAIIAVPLLLPETKPATSGTISLDFDTTKTSTKQPATSKSTTTPAATETTTTKLTASDPMLGTAKMTETTPEVEVPQAGEAAPALRQASFGTIAIAGSCVIVATLGATLLIVRQRKL